MRQATENTLYGTSHTEQGQPQTPVIIVKTWGLTLIPMCCITVSLRREMFGTYSWPHLLRCSDHSRPHLSPLINCFKTLIPTPSALPSGSRWDIHDKLTKVNLKGLGLMSPCTPRRGQEKLRGTIGSLESTLWSWEGLLDCVLSPCCPQPFQLTQGLVRAPESLLGIRRYGVPDKALFLPAGLSLPSPGSFC